MSLVLLYGTSGRNDISPVVSAYSLNSGRQLTKSLSLRYPMTKSYQNIIPVAKSLTRNGTGGVMDGRGVG